MKGSIENEKAYLYSYVIIDGMNYAHKYYEVHKNLSYNGKPTGMIYGFLNQVNNFRNWYKGTKVVVVWDTKPEFKLSLYPEYKANRLHDKGNGFDQQKKILRGMLSFLGVNQFIAKGYEADDVAAYIIKKINARTGKKPMILLASEDVDWCQNLEHDNVNVYRKKEVWGRNKFESKNELININSMRVYKSIVGEKKENLKGIPFIKKKYASELAFDCIDLNHLKTLCELRERKKDKWATQILLNWGNIIERNYQLKGLISEGYVLSKMKANANKEKLISNLKEMGMNALCERIENEI